MGKLFNIVYDDPRDKVSSKTGSQIKLKKGDNPADLGLMARKLVEEKLGKYKDLSRCVVEPEDLQSFFDDTPDGVYMAIDTETTRLILG